MADAESSRGPGHSNQASSPSVKIPDSKKNFGGYLNKLQPGNVLGWGGRRYWFVISEDSSYFYFYKDKNDLKAVGRIALVGSALTYDARKTHLLEIHSDTHYVLEAASEEDRDEWVGLLQDARKQAYLLLRDNERRTSTTDIVALTISPVPYEEPERISTSLPSLESISPQPQPPPRSRHTSYNFPLTNDLSSTNEKEKEKPGPSNFSNGIEDKSLNERALQELVSELGPVEPEQDQDQASVSSEDGKKSGCIPSHSQSAFESVAVSANSIFYLTDGELNSLSWDMPQEMVTPESIFARFTNNIKMIERDATVYTKSKLKLLSIKPNNCEQCKKWKAAVEDAESRCCHAEDEIETLKEMISKFKIGMSTIINQVDSMSKLAVMKGNGKQVAFLLEKEKAMTKLQMEANDAGERARIEQEKNRNLENEITRLKDDCESYRLTLRAKEEKIIELTHKEFEQQEVHVPEGIPLDTASFDSEKIIIQACSEDKVIDLSQMANNITSYKALSRALNKEIMDQFEINRFLRDIVTKIRTQNFHLQACFYQLKSRYLMVLNHFTQPEKTMAPEILRRIVDEATRLTNTDRRANADTLGFYNESNGEFDVDGMLEEAIHLKIKHNQIVEANNLEQSKDHLKWLEDWDGLLVNTFHRNYAPNDELKKMIRTGIPKTYRARVWKHLVHHVVRDIKAEHGNGYFSCLLQKSKSKRESGKQDMDSSIKQIDLDLARTMPTNKYFDDPSSEKIESLRQVLYAFRYHNPDVSYCQGLNRLAAVGLLYLSEEEAFWFLVACVEILQPDGYYNKNLLCVSADQRVLLDLVKERMPHLAQHMQTMDVDITVFTLSWFLTCFVDLLPHTIYLNIFDDFLYEGNKVLFRFALAVLKLGETRLMDCKTSGAMHAALNQAAEFVKDYKSLSDMAFGQFSSFSSKPIETKRKYYLNELMNLGYF